MPPAHLEGSRHAETHQSREVRPKVSLQTEQMLLNGGQQYFSIREGIFKNQTLAHLAGQIHQNRVGRATPNLDADAKSTVGIQRKRYRRLPNETASRAFSQQQPGLHQPRRNQSNGLRGEAC